MALDLAVAGTSAQLPGQGTSRGGRWIAAVLLLCTIGLLAAAALLGYWQHQPGTRGEQADDRQPAASVDPDRSSTQSDSASAVEREEIIDEVATKPPSGPTAGLRWPLWEFQLRLPIPPRDPPLTPPSWRLIGATSSGGKPNLIILRQGKTEPEFYRTGDTLPGGYVVGEITDEDVTLIHGKQAVLLSYIGTR